MTFVDNRDVNRLWFSDDDDGVGDDGDLNQAQTERSWLLMLKKSYCVSHIYLDFRSFGKCIVLTVSGLNCERTVFF
jgi:hypothetical protein